MAEYLFMGRFILKAKRIILSVMTLCMFAGIPTVLLWYFRGSVPGTVPGSIWVCFLCAGLACITASIAEYWFEECGAEYAARLGYNKNIMLALAVPLAATLVGIAIWFIAMAADLPRTEAVAGAAMLICGCVKLATDGIFVHVISRKIG